MSAAAAVRLSAEFKDLETFGEWCLGSERERNAKRLSSTLEELSGFYSAMLPRMPAIVEELRSASLRQMPDDQRNLMWLAMSLMEISACIELFRAVAVPHAVPGERISIET